MKFLDNYDVIKGSDVIRDGIYLELQYQGKTIAEIFYNDSEHSMVLNTFSNDIPISVIQPFITKAQKALKPENHSTNATDSNQ